MQLWLPTIVGHAGPLLVWLFFFIVVVFVVVVLFCFVFFSARSAHKTRARAKERGGARRAAHIRKTCKNAYICIHFKSFSWSNGEEGERENNTVYIYVK